MSRTPDATRARLLLATLFATGLALVLPSLLFPPVDGTATVSLAVVALLFAAVVRLGNHGAVLAARVVSAGPPTAGEAPLLLAGRITDPVHHPLRPRAPGLA
jgi:hypothetical protein